ncbi:MAG: VOC family protein [Gammaproteobacteria bacterium]
MFRLPMFALVFAASAVARAQVLPFNEAGVTMGHHHLLVSDVEAQKRIWVDVLGGEPSGNPPLLFVKFPGVLLILTNGNGVGGTQGSALEHIAFDVRDIAGVRAALAAAGVPISSSSESRFVATMPGGVEVHFHSAPSLEAPIAHRSVAFASTDPDAQREWWERVLGARTSGEGERAVTSIPGARLEFRRAETAPAPTRGRVLDHTGIGVEDVGAFCAKLAEQGIECELLFGGAAAMITDPAGVAIEINSGLESR